MDISKFVIDEECEFKSRFLIRVEELLERLASDDTDGFTMTYEKDSDSIFFTINYASGSREQTFLIKSSNSAIVRELKQFFNKIYNYI